MAPPAFCAHKSIQRCRQSFAEARRNGAGQITDSYTTGAVHYPAGPSESIPQQTVDFPLRQASITNRLVDRANPHTLRKAPI